MYHVIYVSYIRIYKDKDIIYIVYIDYIDYINQVRIG